MPTYQYACTSTDCGNRFELVQSFTDPSASECPVCTGPVRKVFSAVGVVFKGSGFYRTDSRSSSAGGASKSTGSTKSDAAASSSSTSSSDSSSDSSSSSSASSNSTSSSGTPSTAAASA